MITGGWLALSSLSAVFPGHQTSDPGLIKPQVPAAARTATAAQAVAATVPAVTAATQAGAAATQPAAARARKQLQAAQRQQLHQQQATQQARTVGSLQQRQQQCQQSASQLHSHWSFCGRAHQSSLGTACSKVSPVFIRVSQLLSRGNSSRLSSKPRLLTGAPSSQAQWRQHSKLQ